MTRATWGEGSVYRRADGQWVAALRLPDGKRRYLYARTQRDVREKLRQARIRLDKGQPAAEDTRTVAEYLGWWIGELKRTQKIDPSTWTSYEQKVRLHLVPTLGRHRLVRLSPTHVRELLNDKLDEGLSNRSVQYIHAVLRASLEQARKWELVERNVAALVDPPRVRQEEVRALSVDEAHRLLQVVKGNRLEAYYRVALTIALRPGEALALHWTDVDLDAGTLRVSGTLKRVDKRWRTDTIKTRGSRKTLPLPPACADALRQHRGRQDAERAHAGSLWQEHGLIFTRADGQPVWPHYVNRDLDVMCERAGLPRMTPQQLRHSAASLLLAQGVDQRVIMEVLRHSTIRLTADLYTHVVGPQLRDALERLDDALG